MWVVFRITAQVIYQSAQTMCVVHHDFTSTNQRRWFTVYISYFVDRASCYVWFLVNDQLDAQFSLCVYFNSVHVSSNLVFIIRRIKCINTISAICHSVSVTVSCAGRKGSFRPVHETVTDTEWHIADVLIHLILLMMSTRLLETFTELK